MRISRLFCPEVSAHGTSVVLSAEASHYLIRVLRHKYDCQVVLFNNFDGLEYLTKITDANPKKAVLTILSSAEKRNESPIKIHLFQALSKGDKLETVIQKATELGVNEITPIITQHVDYKLAKERLTPKLEHWQKIAISASEQSGRVFVPKINYPILLTNALQQDADIKLFLSPHSSKHIATLHKLHLTSKTFAIYIGPEGGFSDKEEMLAIDYSCNSIQLGSRTLRTETAPVAMISILQALWGDY